MKNTGLRWRFVNQSNSSETILVHDQESAQILATILLKMGGDWMMQEERSLGSLQKHEQPQQEAKHHQQQDQGEQSHDHIEEEQMAQHATEEHHHEESHAESKTAAPPPAPKKQEKSERRSQPRYMTEFRVILISGSSSFRTMSQDVSLGGMRLKKSIPTSFLKEKCIAYVSHKDLRENIEIVCHVIADPTDACRIQFLQPNQTQLKRLGDWLSEHNNAGKKVAS